MSTTVAPGTTPPCASLMVPSTLPVVIWADTGSALKTATARAAATDKTLCTIATPPDLTWTFCEIRHDDRRCTMPLARHLPGAEQAEELRSRHIQNRGEFDVKRIRKVRRLRIGEFVN